MFSPLSNTSVRMKGSQTKNENQQSSVSPKRSWSKDPHNHMVSTDPIIEWSILSNWVDSIL